MSSPPIPDDQVRAAYVSFALAAAGTGVALAFFLMTLFCGMVEVRESMPGQPPNTPSCLSAPHPMATVFMALAALGALLGLRGMAWPLIGIGVLMTGLAILFVLSMGLWGLGSALLVLASGLALLPPVRKALAGAPAKGG